MYINLKYAEKSYYDRNALEFFFFLMNNTYVKLIVQQPSCTTDRK